MLRTYSVATFSSPGRTAIVMGSRLSMGSPEAPAEGGSRRATRAAESTIAIAANKKRGETAERMDDRRRSDEDNRDVDSSYLFKCASHLGNVTLKSSRAATAPSCTRTTETRPALQALASMGASSPSSNHTQRAFCTRLAAKAGRSALSSRACEGGIAWWLAGGRMASGVALHFYLQRVDRRVGGGGGGRWVVICTYVLRT